MQLSGALVLPQHCVLHCEFVGDTHRVTMTRFADALIYVNGHECKAGEGEPQELHNSDRLIIGNHHFFRVNLPKLR